MTDTGLKVLFAAFALMLVPLVLYALVLFGPVGLLFLLLLCVAAVGGVHALRDEERTPDRVNCPACGAPNQPDREACRHCDGAL